MPKVTWIGQAAVLVEGNNTKFIIDPFITGNPDVKEGTFKPEDVNVDYILLTHGHWDHLGDAIDIAKRTKATIVAPFELVDYCSKKGVENVHPMHIGGAHRFSDDFWVKLTIAHHGSAVINDEDGVVYTGNPCGFLVEIDGKVIYHAGDTGLFLDMQLIGQMRDIDLAILPIGDNFTMGPEDAAKAVEFLKPKMVMPIHYLAWDLIKQDPNEFAKLVGDKAAVKAIMPGESLDI
ncbi:metal-dependent hydrolase [Hippea sp. KM1]|uniref:metal-dependent hydrolase n=1 Tax=Hippea sp. KM1 TaxID=944481 RepID=UPI00046D3309|nr:metal-dependent hydrolase [Hippea sp. KM1]